jgi:hypothetical protein
MLNRKSYAWTPEDETTLKELADKGMHLRAIALRLRRSESSIKKKAYDLDIQVKRPPRYRDLVREQRFNSGIS